MARTRLDLPLHILSKIEKRKGPLSSACWIWTGTRLKEGYGQTSYYENGKQVRLATHRVMYEHVHGSIPDNLLCCHKCDNPTCCNPKHIFLGTDADNCKDRMSKNRSATGDRSGARRFPHKFQGDNNGRAILTRKFVEDLRVQYRRGMPRGWIKNTAEKLGVKVVTLSLALRGGSWKSPNQERRGRSAV